VSEYSRVKKERLLFIQQHDNFLLIGESEEKPDTKQSKANLE
jgi:hypothetical protein